MGVNDVIREIIKKINMKINIKMKKSEFYARASGKKSSILQN